jgi:dihydrofolate synthase/folylpolyglutamate synthase
MTVVIGDLPVEARTVIQEVAGQRHAALIHAQDDTEVQAQMSRGRAHLAIATPQERYGPFRLSLRGTHQIRNAVVAIRLLEALDAAGLRVPRHAIEQALTTVDWPARLEVLALSDGKQLLLDAAHNVEGARMLAAYLAEWYPQRPPLVLGVMRDKDVDGIVRALLPVTSLIVASAPPLRRGLDAAELAARVTALESTRTVLVEPDPARAVETAKSYGDTVCVAGSIVLAGAVRDAFRHHAILH